MKAKQSEMVNLRLVGLEQTSSSKVPLARPPCHSSAPQCQSRSERAHAIFFFLLGAKCGLWWPVGMVGLVEDWWRHGEVDREERRAPVKMGERRWSSFPCWDPRLDSSFCWTGDFLRIFSLFNVLTMLKYSESRKLYIHGKLAFWRYVYCVWNRFQVSRFISYACLKLSTSKIFSNFSHTFTKNR